MADDDGVKPPKSKPKIKAIIKPISPRFKWVERLGNLSEAENKDWKKKFPELAKHKIASISVKEVNETNGETIDEFWDNLDKKPGYSFTKKGEAPPNTYGEVARVRGIPMGKYGNILHGLGGVLGAAGVGMDFKDFYNTMENARKKRDREKQGFREEGST